MGFCMSKKSQILISIFMIICCIYAIVYYTDFKSDIYEAMTSKEVNTLYQADKNIENTYIYDNFLEHFDCHGEKYYYAFIKLAGYDYPILLLSNGVYNFKNEAMAAMGTYIYYPIDNQITKLGSIGSDGTAYPISANTTGIFTAGGHEVTKYGLDLKNHQIKLINKYMMIFYTVGEEVKSITIRITDDENQIVTENEFDKANKEYGDANIIYFRRLC